jgi:aspartokinase
MDPIVVQKFGGSSVADAAAFRRVVGKVRATGEGQKPVVVTSALGGTTDTLLDAVQRAISGDLEGALRSLAALLDRHHAVAGSVLGPAVLPAAPRRR